MLDWLCAHAGVYFGQLLGMADHLSFTLGRAGYRIHKIVPYGPVHETLQYLIRRAQVLLPACHQAQKENRLQDGYLACQREQGGHSAAQCTCTTRFTVTAAVMNAVFKGRQRPQS